MERAVEKKTFRTLEGLGGLLEKVDDLQVLLEKVDELQVENERLEERLQRCQAMLESCEREWNKQYKSGLLRAAEMVDKLCMCEGIDIAAILRKEAEG